MLGKFFEWLKGKKESPVYNSCNSGVMPKHFLHRSYDEDYIETDVVITTINFDHHFYRSEDTSYHNTHSDIPSDFQG